MKKTFITLAVLVWTTMTFAQSDVLQTAQKTNNYFMMKYSDPRCPPTSKRCVPRRYGHVPCTTKD